MIVLRNVKDAFAKLRDAAMGRPDEWHSVNGSSPKLLQDGSYSEWGQRLMRRKIKGVWHYRQQTTAEQKAIALDEAW